eukprot:4789344-Pyramimonas_sp.AAC.1
MAAPRGSRAHRRATKFRVVVQPTAVGTVHGPPTHVHDVVRREAELYKKLWASSRPVPVWITDREKEVPPPSRADQVVLEGPDGEALDVEVGGVASI